MVNQATVQDKTVQLCQEFLRKLLGSYQSNAFAVRFWDGATWQPTPHYPAAYTLVLQHPGALRKMFWPPNDLALGEAYVHNDFDLEGDIMVALRLWDMFGAARPIEVVAQPAIR